MAEKLVWLVDDAHVGEVKVLVASTWQFYELLAEKSKADSKDNAEVLVVVVTAQVQKSR